MKRTGVLIVAAITLFGCGKAEELQPALGRSLPVRPLGAATTPTANVLLTLPAQARPERIDEPLRRSEEREADPFDLPPPGEPE